MATVKKKKKAFLPRIAMVIIFVVAVIYAAYHIISLFSGEDIKTIASGVTTHSVTVGGTGYVFRDEVLLSADNKGAVNYLVKDGGKVSAEQTLADIYEGSGVLVRDMVIALDRQIAILEQSTGGAEPLDLGALRAQANDTYYKLVELLATSQTGELHAQIESMMITLNRISVMTDGQDTVLDTLATLKRTRENLFKGDYETAYAPGSGYFYYTADGYESSFDMDAVENLSEESFYSLIESVEQNTGRVADTVFGKLARTSDWKLVVPIDEKDAAGFEDGSVFNLNFPENNDTKISMTLEKTVKAPESDSVLCVFYCDRLPSNFSLERCQSVELELFSASGIYVPRTALARVDGIRGVFVLRGSVVYFRRVEIVYEGSDYCLVSENAKAEGGYYALGTNELIITNGKNLFDGRILE